jgi:hypothetical protein
MWLYLWYRESRQSARLKGSELVEHEGFMTFLASRAGARVPEVVTAGRSGKGDALIVTRPTGRPLEVDDIALTTEQIDSLWEQLAILHAAGIAHHRIELDRVNRLSEGTACFGDMSSLSVQATESDQCRDRAQLLSLATLTAGEDAAVASARESLGDTQVADLLPYLQEAALPPSVHSALNKQHVELDDVRERLSETLGAPKVDLVKLRRVTWGSIFNVTLLTVAAYTIIGMFGASISRSSRMRSTTPIGGGSCLPCSSARHRVSLPRSARSARRRIHCRSARRPAFSSRRAMSTSPFPAPPAASR